MILYSSIKVEVAVMIRYNIIFCNRLKSANTILWVENEKNTVLVWRENMLSVFYYNKHKSVYTLTAWTMDMLPWLQQRHPSLSFFNP